MASGSEIIWKFLERQHHEDKLGLYIIITTELLNHQSPVMITFSAEALEVFRPFYPEALIKTVIEGFINKKRSDYKLGLLKVKPFY